MKEDTEYFKTLLETATAKEADRLLKAADNHEGNREHYWKLADERLRDLALRRQAIERVNDAELKAALLEKATQQETDLLREADGQPKKQYEHYRQQATERLQDHQFRYEALKRLKRRSSPQSPAILCPLIWSERRAEKILAFLRRLALLEILALVSNIGIIVAIAAYVGTEKQRRDDVVFTAWQTITNAENQPGNGGRIKALEFLNASRGATWRRRSLCLWLCTWAPESLDGINLAAPENTAGAYLAEINLSDASLRAANLSNANLSNANLIDANLIDANLTNANLFNANLTNADLTDANLFNADLFNAKLIDVQLLETDLPNAILAAADLSNAILAAADLSNANLHNADLSNAYITSTDLSNADLGFTYFSNAIFLATDVRESRYLKPRQFTIPNPPLLCNVALPQSIVDAGVVPNRDCDRLPQILSDRYDWMTLEGAQQIVEEAQLVQWDEPDDTTKE